MPWNNKPPSGDEEELEPINDENSPHVEPQPADAI